MPRSSRPSLETAVYRQATLRTFAALAAFAAPAKPADDPRARAMLARILNDFIQVMSVSVEVIGDIGCDRGRRVRRGVVSGDVEQFYPEVNLLGPDSAQGYFKLHDWVIIGGATVMRGFGQYDNRFTRRNGRWEIQHITLIYSYREEHRAYVDNERLLATEAMRRGG